ncbi:hypothetical protein [Streptomyces sp. WZ-12]|uniref:hypothetical protein n=1 Tax=Streptomyces sp. WZ-12 TaxID=3030210 RepID=UPI0023815805|nr:hypothetical protein [Streptomyces sp. WZ-12]
MPLRSISITDWDENAQAPHGLHHLRQLESLQLYALLPPEDLGTLPADAPLRSLTLSHPDAINLTPLASWPLLDTLHLQCLTNALHEDQWYALSHLPKLTRLTLHAAEDTTTLRVPSDLRLPQVIELWHQSSRTSTAAEITEQLRTLFPVFPHLRALRLYGTNGDSAPINLTLHPRPRT